MIRLIVNKIKKDNSAKEIIWGGGTSFLLTASGMLFGYLLTALISNLYGVNILGVYSLSFNTLTLLTTLSLLGLDTVVLRSAGKNGNTANSKKVLSLSKKMVAVSTAIVSVFLVVFSVYFSDSFLKENEYSVYLLVVAFTVILSVYLKINVEYLCGLKKIKLSEFLRNVSRLLLMLIMIPSAYCFTDSSFVPVLTLFLATLISLIISRFYILRQQVEKNYDESVLDDRSSLLSQSLPMLVSAVSMYLIGNMCVYFVQANSGAFDVGLISVAIKLSVLVVMPLMVIERFAASRLSNFFWGGKKVELQMLLMRVARISTFLSLSIAAFIWCFSKWMLGIFGNDFVEAEKYLWVLLVGQVVNGMTGSTGMFMNMSGNERAYQYISLIGAAVSFVMYLIFVPRYGAMAAVCILGSSVAAINVILGMYVQNATGYRTIYLPFRNKN